MRKVLVFGFLLLLAVGWHAGVRYALVANDNAHVALVVADQIVKLFREDTQLLFRSQCQILAEDPRLKSTLSTPDMDEITIVDILKDLRTLSGAQVIAVLSANARVKGQVGIEALRGLDVSTAALIRKARKSSEAIAGVWVVGDKPFELGACTVVVQDRVIAYLVIGRSVEEKNLAMLADVAKVSLAIIVGDHVALSAPASSDTKVLFDMLARDPTTVDFRQLGDAKVARVVAIPETTPPSRIAFIVNRDRQPLLLNLLLWVPVAVITLLSLRFVWKRRFLG